jgi:hypothetical protein
MMIALQGDAIRFILPDNRLLVARLVEGEFPDYRGVVGENTGRFLRPIVDAIKLPTCEYITEFNPREFEPPADSDAPFVERITIQTGRTTARQPEKETES